MTAPFTTYGNFALSNVLDRILETQKIDGFITSDQAENAWRCLVELTRRYDACVVKDKP